jgi:hypothetical protein
MAAMRVPFYARDYLRDIAKENATRRAGSGGALIAWHG